VHTTANFVRENHPHSPNQGKCWGQQLKQISARWVTIGITGNHRQAQQDCENKERTTSESSQCLVSFSEKWCPISPFVVDAVKDFYILLYISTHQGVLNDVHYLFCLSDFASASNNFMPRNTSSGESLFVMLLRN
jgi:hypothetical protein